MAFDLYIRSTAARDVQSAGDWYEEKRKGLGRQFVRSVTALMERIRQQPETNAVIHKGVRLAHLKRFQYVIAYLFENEEVEIIAVSPAHRDPDVWQSRI